MKVISDTKSILLPLQLEEGG